MVLCTIIYDPASGSDTAASGSNAPTTPWTQADFATLTSTLGSTTFTFSDAGTHDLTNGKTVLADGTDVLYFDSSSTASRKLFRIVSYTGGADACTAIETAENADVGETRDWAIGGKRKTLDVVTALPDFEQAAAGWRFELEAGSYQIDNASLPIALPAEGDNTDGAMEIVAAAGDSPIIHQTHATAHTFEPAAGNRLICRGIKFTGTGTTRAYFCYVDDCHVKMIDCISTMGRPLVYTQGSNGRVDLIRCEIDGATDGLIQSTGGRVHWRLIDCWIHDCGDNAIQIVVSNANLTMYCKGCRFTNNAGTGIFIDVDQSGTSLTVLNCTFHGNLDDGIELWNNHSNPGPIVIMNNIFTLEYWNSTSQGQRPSRDSHLPRLQCLWGRRLCSNNSGCRLGYRHLAW